MLLEYTLRRLGAWVEIVANVVLARTAAGLLARRLFVSGAVLPVLLGSLATELVHHQYLSRAGGLALFVVATVIAGAIVAWSAAATVARMDQGREAAEQARLLLTARLQRYAIELQETVSQRTRELREANASLRATAESNALLALVAQHTINGVIIMDAAGRTQWVNSAFTRMSGYKLADIQGHTPGEMLQGPGTDLAALEQLRQAQQDGVQCQLEALAYTKLGRPYWVTIDFQPVRDRSGRVVNLVCNLADITEERMHQLQLQQTTDELKLLNERLQLALRSSNFGVWEFDLIHRKRHWDARMLELHGITRAEFNASDTAWTQRFHPEDLTAVEAQLQRVIDGKSGDYAVEYRVIQPDGEVRHIEAHGHLQHDETGRVVRLVGLTRDRTEHRKLEERLRKSEELGRVVSRLALIGGWELDMRNSRITWTEGTRRIYEVDDAFVPTVERVWSFHPAESRQTIETAMADVTALQPDFDVEVPLQTTSDRRIWTRIIGHGEFADGVLVNVHGAIQDITARHESEAAQRELEAQLFQAQKMETLGTLAGGIAHDFNNLLTGILGYHELATESIPPGHPARESLAEARNASLKARELVEQILTFGRQPNNAKHVPVDVTKVMGDARRFLRATLPANIVIEVECAPECGPVLGDATQIHQVILNLGSNAAHAMRRSGGTLRLKLEPADVTPELALTLGGPAAARYVRLTVSDTGHGMDEATRRRIFDPFFTTKGTREGTGLGLAVVHGIVRAHRAIIDVESAPGRGSTFRVYFPTVAETVVQAEMNACVPHGAGEFVCVVDDEEVVGSCTRMVLENHGYRSLTFRSAEKCLDRLRGNPDLCSVLVTDQTMPGMQGTELATALRELKPDLPVVIMSGYFSKISAHALDELGRVELLAKPFTTDELANAVHRALHPAVPAAYETETR